MGLMETFNFLEYAAGTKHPEDTVNIYIDADAAYKLGILESKINSTIDSNELEALEAEAATIRERFEASRVEVHLKGIPRSERKKLSDRADEEFGKEDSEEKDAWFSKNLVAKHIVKAVNANGAEDTDPWDLDKVEQLYNLVTDESVIRLVNKVSELSTRTDIFENVEVNPDF